jgi:soluble lytic murein transglycosylase-like protein
MKNWFNKITTQGCSFVLIKSRRMQQFFVCIASFIVLFISLSLSLQTLANTANKVPRQAVDEELKTELKQAILASDSFEDRFDAEVWLTAMSHKLKRYIKDPKERLSILRKVHSEATRAGLEPELVLAVIQIESAFNPYAVSVVGAQGMMQVMPFWKKEIGRVEDNLINLDTNLRYGTTILKHYIDREKGKIAPGLARYNGSYGSTKYSSKVMNAWFDRWR